MSDDVTKPCFEMTRRVEFHDTDMAGIVHFANFFRYMESAEHAFLRSIGHPIHEKLGAAVIGWPRVNANCDYRRPARFGDVLTVRVSLEEIRTRAVRYGFTFHVDPAGPAVASGTITAVCVEMREDGIKAVPIPAGIRAGLEKAGIGTQRR